MFSGYDLGHPGWLTHPNRHSALDRLYY